MIDGHGSKAMTGSSSRYGVIESTESGGSLPRQTLSPKWGKGNTQIVGSDSRSTVFFKTK